jgi:hypothetical protein
MSEEVARAVAAKSPTTVMIAGKECSPRPLGLRELSEVERDCLQRFKRECLKTYAENIDLLPEKDRDRLLEKKMDQIARWTTDDLPPKRGFISADVELTEELKKWVAKEFEPEEDATDDQYKLLTGLALDQSILSVEQYAELTGKTIRKVNLDYVSWWATSSFDGMITFIWKAFSNLGVTREQVLSDLGSSLGRMTELAKEIEHLSTPTVGNP